MLFRSIFGDELELFKLLLRGRPLDNKIGVEEVRENEGRRRRVAGLPALEESSGAGSADALRVCIGPGAGKGKLEVATEGELVGDVRGDDRGNGTASCPWPWS